MKKSFKVVKVTEKRNGKGFITTIRHTTVAKDIFGTKKSENYSVSGVNKLEIDSEIELDLSNYEITEREFEYQDETSGELRKGTWNWLGIKGA